MGACNAICWVARQPAESDCAFSPTLLWRLFISSFLLFLGLFLLLLLLFFFFCFCFVFWNVLMWNGWVPGRRSECEIGQIIGRPLAGRRRRSGHERVVAEVVGRGGRSRQRRQRRLPVEMGVKGEVVDAVEVAQVARAQRWRRRGRRQVVRRRAAAPQTLVRMPTVRMDSVRMSVMLLFICFSVASSERLWQFYQIKLQPKIKMAILQNSNLMREEGEEGGNDDETRWEEEDKNKECCYWSLEEPSGIGLLTIPPLLFSLSIALKLLFSFLSLHLPFLHFSILHIQIFLSFSLSFSQLLLLSFFLFLKFLFECVLYFYIMFGSFQAASLSLAHSTFHRIVSARFNGGRHAGQKKKHQTKHENGCKWKQTKK